MKHIVYVSTAIALLKDSELIDMLNDARKCNAAHNITGVLLYSEGTFIQLIEGDAKDINQLYENIVHDPRHKNVIKLIDKHLDQRSFADWTMGFASVDPHKTNDLLGYLKSIDSILESEQSAVEILKVFITSNRIDVNVSYSKF